MDVPSSTCRNHSNRLAVDAASGLCEECARTPEQQTTSGPTAPPDPPIGSETHSAPASNSEIRPSDILPDVLRDTSDRDHSGAEVNVLTRDYELSAFSPVAPEGCRLYRVLNTGGMGIVRLATQDGRGDLGPSRVVAIKFGTQRPDRMAIEAVVQGSLRHPNILGVFTWGETNMPYVVMEYASGGSLLGLVSPKNSDGKRERRPLPPGVAARWMEQVCAAAHAAHTHPKKIIHRDIKPGNIVLTRGGDGDVPADPDALWVKPPSPESRNDFPYGAYVPRLADFGLAKRLAVKDGATIDTVALGTPSYMSPEQWDTPGDGTDEAAGPAVDARADVYAIGATLHHLLCGEPPFRGEPVEIRQQVLNDEPPPLRSLKPDVPRELEAIVWKCLRKNREERYQSAEDVRLELERYLDDPATVQAPRLDWWWRRWRNVRRNRGAIAACALAVAVFVAGAAVAWPPKPEVRDVVAEHHRNFRAGNLVELVPAKGLPAWHNRTLGLTTLAVSPEAEDACAMESVSDCVVELLPGVDGDQYTLSMESAELANKGQLGDLDLQYHALIFGYARQPAPDGSEVHSFFAVIFRDYDPNIARNLPPRPQTVRVEYRAFVCKPGKSPGKVAGSTRGWIEFWASQSKPGKWRQVTVDAARDSIKVAWRGDDDKMQPVADLNKARIEGMVAEAQKMLDDAFPQLGVTLPEWSPRRAIAVWSARSAFAFRNVLLRDRRF